MTVFSSLWSLVCALLWTLGGGVATPIYAYKSVTFEYNIATRSLNVMTGLSSLVVLGLCSSLEFGLYQEICTQKYHFFQ